jgi:hypothetical protein
MTSVRCFQGVLFLWGSNYNGNMNFLATPFPLILKTAMIDCPVASIGSTSINIVIKISNIGIQH